ncbi:hypothetical protein [Pantoea dispersa]|uniref:hypothetical protein n=1 Tax=Pantoea dispersa TaxID=59814 RepID=UPI00222390BF|nr:hypothetical protein [Pantoea dispersa]UYV58072.1 hypothetical protein OH655_03095 [Pantoea dispersa]WEA06471.1 hypothetical protein PWF83_03400 [Pantoea dispersa]
MNGADFFLYLAFLLIFFALIMQVFSYYIFKKNERKYVELISEFRRRNLDLDIVTNIYSFLGPLFNANKIVYFIDLYNGRAMKLAKGKPVSKNAYNFMQSQPKENISWMLRLHNLNLISFFLLFSGVGIGLIIGFI